MRHLLVMRSMHTYIKIALTVILVFTGFSSFSQKRITEGTITYDLIVQTGNSNPTIADMFNGASSVVYLKGYLCRFDIANALGVQSTIVDKKTGDVNVIKEFGEQKYIIKMTSDNWLDANKKYDSIQFRFTEEYKDIAGYHCQKAVGTMKDGTVLNVFFTRELIADNREFEYAYKNLPGLAMEYETSIGSYKITYRVSKINFNIVSSSKFDLPKSGFRIMSYEESQSVSEE